MMRPSLGRGVGAEAFRLAHVGQRRGVGHQRVGAAVEPPVPAPPRITALHAFPFPAQLEPYCPGPHVKHPSKVLQMSKQLRPCRLSNRAFSSASHPSGLPHSARHVMGCQ